MAQQKPETHQVFLMRIIFVVMMSCGMAIVIDEQFRQASVVAVWSDFKMFEKRVSELENGKQVLSLGGADENSKYEKLLVDLWAWAIHPT